MLRTGWPDGPAVMGIVNATPDSFSDGNAASSAHTIDRALAMGADIVDVGGESTRPGADPVDPAEEQARVMPILAGLRDRGLVLSVDTRNAGTMRLAVAAGARIVNDVSALTHDPAAADTVAELGCDVILVHSRGTPRTMRSLARYGDVVAAVRDELADRVARAVSAGIDRRRIAIDPGLGFAKTTSHNRAVLRNLDMLSVLGLPIVIGASRKRFIGDWTGQAVPADRDAGSLAAHLFALAKGATILRTHDVPHTIAAVKVWRKLNGSCDEIPVGSNG